MSKMSQLHAELTEQAAELGFQSIEEAEANGYEVTSDGVWAKLVKTKTEEDKAYEAWLKEREEVIKSLEHAIDFIKGCNL